MKVFVLNKEGRLSANDKAEIVTMLRQGQVIVVPTDTSYGLAALVSNQKAVEKVFRLKGRAKQKTVSIAVRSREQALEYGRISCKSTKLWRAFLPGPLTLVVESKIKRAYLVRHDNTVAIRRLATKSVNQLLRDLPAPITITSANRSGKKDIYSVEQFKAQYRGKTLPDAFINAGKLPKSELSTVVKVNDRMEIVRQGAISRKQIEKALNKQQC